jgi:hypothetical protein
MTYKGKLFISGADLSIKEEIILTDRGAEYFDLRWKM